MAMAIIYHTISYIYVIIFSTIQLWFRYNDHILGMTAEPQVKEHSQANHGPFSSMMYCLHLFTDKNP
jgi:hypothetical protein